MRTGTASRAEWLVQGATVADGRGGPLFPADILIAGGRIVRLAESVAPGPATRVLPARGLVAAPGFVNLHGHSDLTSPVGGNALNSVCQGLTSEVVGGDGRAAYGWDAALPAAPLRPNSFHAELVTWSSLESWRATVERNGTAIHYVPFCGHDTLRRAVLGVASGRWAGSPATPDEMRAMEGLLARAMDEGAFGLATGLQYTPGASTDEVIALCRVVAARGGVHISHIRNLGERLIESVAEIVAITRATGVPASINHHHAWPRAYWGRAAESLALIDRARAEGLPVIFDTYPWEFTEIFNTVRLFQQENPDLGVTRTWAELDPAARERLTALARLHAIADSPSSPELAGCTLAEAAVRLGAPDLCELLIRLNRADGGRTVGAVLLSEEENETLLRHPCCAVSTDGGAFDYPLRGNASGHPRAWGTYPRVLERYVRERRVLTLEDAVRKMSALPASFLGLADRGVLREGAWADLVLFDPAAVRNTATYAEPRSFPEGIPYVWVNGVLVVDRGRSTGARPGRVLRRSAAPARPARGGAP